LRIAFDQNAALVHHRDAIGNGKDAVDVVLHQQHCHMGSEGADQCRYPLSFRRGETD
jgi:hypothetical protein